MEKKIEIGKKAKVRVSWKVRPTECTDESKRSIISLMAKKYEIPEKNVELEVIYDTKNKNGEEDGLYSTAARSIQDPKFCIELYKQWLKDNDITDYNFDDILKIDSQVNSLIDFTVYEKSKRYQIKWVKWSNFLSYGEDNYFDFTQLKGLVLLNGEPANESGKSTFAYDLLHFLLFGKINPDRAKTNDQLFNNYRDSNEVVVEGCINIDGDDYVIRRTLTRKSKGKSASQKVAYFKVLEDGELDELSDNTNEVGENTAKTNRIIKESLGNEKDFDLIISANAKDLDDLISMGETDRGKLLTRWIGLSPLEDKETKAKELYKNISKGRFCDLYNVVDLNTEIENNNSSITDYNNNIVKLNEQVTNASNELTGLNDKKDQLLLQKKEIDSSVLNLDMKTVENKINDIIATGKNNKAILEANTKQLEEIGDVDFDKTEYDTNVKTKEALIADIATLKAGINSLEKENVNLANLEYCPTCGRKLDNVDNSVKINENKQKIELSAQTLAEKQQEKAKIELQIANLEEKRELSEKKSKISLKIVAVKSDIESGRLEYKEQKSLLDKLLQNKDVIIRNNQIDADVNLVKANIQEQENIVKNCSYNIALFNKSIETCNDKIRDCKSKITKIEEEKKEERAWKLYLQMIGKDGICKMVLRHALPIINGELENLLNDCSDFNVEVTLNESNSVEFWLIRDGIRTRLSAASGLEKTQASLALRVVLGKMSRLSCPPFILLDEVLGTVAASNYDNMKLLYDKIVSLYDFVLHITHLESINDWHDMTLTIVKKDNISSVKPLIRK